MKYFATLKKGIDFTVAKKTFLKGQPVEIDYNMFQYLQRHRDQFKLDMVGDNEAAPEAEVEKAPEGGPIEVKDLGTAVADTPVAKPAAARAARAAAKQAEAAEKGE